MNALSLCYAYIYLDKCFLFQEFQLHTSIYGNEMVGMNPYHMHWAKFLLRKIFETKKWAFLRSLTNIVRLPPVQYCQSYDVAKSHWQLQRQRHRQKREKEEAYVRQVLGCFNLILLANQNNPSGEAHDCRWSDGCLTL